MNTRAEFGSNGGAERGLVDVIPICDGFVLFKANPQKPPPDEEMPIAIAEVLPKWLKENPVRVRQTLPIVKGGNTIGLFVWFDRAGP